MMSNAIDWLVTTEDQRWLNADNNTPQSAKMPVYITPMTVSSLIRENRETNPTSTTVTTPASTDPTSIAGA